VSDSNRRQFLKGALTALASAAGSITLASTAVAAGRSQEKGKRPEEGGAPAGDLQQRADELAAPRDPVAEGAPVADAWRNGGWHNGVWRNGGFSNFPWRNGTWGNGGWSNIPWFNGGWRNGGWRNW
jgi:hypothetical protein